MISKSSSTLYLFDFDGTLFGENKWYNFWRNTYACYTRGPYLNPSAYDIRWDVLTGRPRIDRPIVWTACHSKGVHPQRIHMYNRWLHNYTDQDVYDFKKKFAMDVLSRSRDSQILDRRINKVFYVDNDVQCVKYLNSEWTAYPAKAMTIFDFRRLDFNAVI